MCGVILIAEKAEKRQLISTILITLKDLILENTSNNGMNLEAEADSYTVFFLLERMFVTYLISYCYFEYRKDLTIGVTELNVENYQDILALVFDDAHKREKFFTLIVSHAARVQGFIR